VVDGFFSKLCEFCDCYSTDYSEICECDSYCNLLKFVLSFLPYDFVDDCVKLVIVL
jgi:hypothetical protein